MKATMIIMALAILVLWLASALAFAGPYFPNITTGAAGYNEVFVPFNAVPNKTYYVETADTVRCDVYELEDDGETRYVGQSGGGPFNITTRDYISELLICSGVWRDELVVIMVY